jgi:H+/Na+-translocating ferredoxin:NAD+ oxidoreductase subunit C
MMVTEQSTAQPTIPTTTIGPAGPTGGHDTFPHGVHPREYKGLTADSPIEVLPTPGEVRIALLQHLGAPCAAVVKPRADLQIGDLVGQTEAFVSAPVHASIAGKATKASAATLPNGRHVDIVPIKAAEEQSIEGRALFDMVLGGEWPTDGLAQYGVDDIIDAVRAGGLVGLGGAAFPTHVKLRRNEQKPIDTLLINGCECEPYLTADYRIMLEAPEPVLIGALLAKQAIGAQRVVIGVEDNKPQALAALREAASGGEVAIRSLKTKYPQGSEKQLIDALLRRKVPTGGLPLDVGVVVMNVGTCATLARAVLRGGALTHRVVTVSGLGIKQPGNLLVPIGASYQHLIDHCGGFTSEAVRVVAGGPMMGFTLGDLNVPVTKGTSGVTVLTPAEIQRTEETACVRCGRCVDVCPINLVPTKIALGARAGSEAIVERYHAPACMECGCCAYECPASIPLVQLIRMGKIMLQNKEK